MQGPQGDPGPEGAAGPQGVQGPQGTAGDPGLSAYDVWLLDGNVGSVDDYLASLVGAQGPQGNQGIQGVAGPAGPAGPAGADGAVGAQGPVGATGATGAAGADGMALSAQPVGFWIKPIGLSGSAAVVNGRLYSVPIWLPGGRSYSNFGVYVTVVVAGSAVRLGVRANSADDKPGALLLDSGTNTTDALNGRFVAIAPVWTPARGLYWLDALFTGGAPTVQTFAPVGLSAQNSMNALSAGYFSDVGQLAALPANPAWSTVGTSAPALGLFRSA